MRSIAIINQKGGVGKTTTAVNLAAALVRAGQRVLLIDMDPQGHATLHVGVEVGPEDETLYTVLTRGSTIAEAARFVDKKLAVVPATIDLVGAELELVETPDRETILSRALHPYSEHFDFVLIDCAPSLGLLSINALSAVTEVIIPLNPHFLALQGLGKLLETVSLVQSSLQPSLRVSGIVFCMCETATRLAQEVYGDVERFMAEAEPNSPWHGAKVFATRVRRNIKLAECPSFGKTIFEYAVASHGADDYRALALEVIGPQPAKLAKSKRVSDVLPAATSETTVLADATPAAPAGA